MQGAFFMQIFKGLTTNQSFFYGKINIGRYKK